MESRKIYPAVLAFASAVLLLCNSAAAQVNVQSDQFDVLQGTCSDYLDVTANDQLGGAVFSLSAPNVSNQPLHGIVVVNGAYISYCADQGYTGADDFDYDVMVGGQTFTGTVYINVLAANNLINAGDADQNGVIENYDVLTIGLAYNLVGPGRDNPASVVSLAWQPSAYLNSDPGAADCNGDGIVQDDDVMLIDSGYGSTFPGNGNYKVDTSECRNGALFYIQAVVSDSVNDGDSPEIDIMLGNNQTVDDAYGIAFTLEVDKGFIDAEGVTFETGQSWILQNTQGLFFNKGFRTDGKVEIALTRTDHNPATGGGVLLRARLPIDDNIDGIVSAPGWHNLHLKLSATRLVSQYDVVQPVCTQQPSLMVYKNATGIAEKRSNTFRLYPNPATDRLFIEAEKIQTVEITDVTGRKLQTLQTGPVDRVWIDLHSLALATGTYFVKVRTAGFVNTKKIFVQH